MAKKAYNLDKLPDFEKLNSKFLALRSTEISSRTILDDNGKILPQDTGISCSVIRLYNSINCHLNYSPGKHISRLFD